MSKTIFGGLLILILCIVGALVWKYQAPKYEEKQQRSTSDAGKMKGTLRFALDDWYGYFPFRSPEYKNRMMQKGWHIRFDDNADIERRMELVSKGEIDLCVFDVSSNILKGKKFGFPTRILAVNDISVGGDQIWANASKIPNLDALKGNQTARIGFTPDSPSEHFLKSTSLHFAVPEIIPPKGDPRRVECNGSSEVLKKLLSGEIDVGVIWEPDGSRIRKANKSNKYVRLLGTEDTDKLIVDLFLANRNFAEKNPEVMQLALDTYFDVLKYYRDNPEVLIKHMKADTRDASEEDVKEMLKGVYWPNLSENCEKWFGIGAQGAVTEAGIVEVIESTVKILINAKDFTDNPIPQGNTFYLTSKKFLETAYKQYMSTEPPKAADAGKATSSLEAKFTPWDVNNWSAAKEVGTIRVEVIRFQSGSSDLNYLAKEIIDQAADYLKKYPKFRLKVVGYTASRGDPQINLSLSQERAEAVAQYLEIVYNIDPNRMLAIGKGGAGPNSQPRVELVLVRDSR